MRALEPFPLEGGRAGLGVRAPPFPQRAGEADLFPFAAFERYSSIMSALTPIPNPSPLEGEGS